MAAFIELVCAVYIQTGNSSLRSSGVHRLFEGQGRKEGHFSVCFGSHEGTLTRVLAPERALQCAFWLPRGHFSMCFGSHEGTLKRVLLPRGHFSMRFGSQEGTLARVLAPKRAVHHVLTSQGGS